MSDNDETEPDAENPGIEDATEVPDGELERFSADDAETKSEEDGSDAPVGSTSETGTETDDGEADLSAEQDAEGASVPAEDGTAAAAETAASEATDGTDIPDASGARKYPPDDSEDEPEPATTDRAGSSENTTSSDFSDAGSARNKWLLFGVGGCGNNLIDSVHLRRHTLEDASDPLAEIWGSGIQGTVSTNTNRTELRESYYAKEVYESGPDEFAGIHKFPGDGAGVNEAEGDRLAQKGFNERRMYARWEGGSRNDIKRAQAVMFLHSAVKGTGSGSTPVIAKRLNKDIRAENDGRPPLYSSVVLPEQGADYLMQGQEVQMGGRKLQNATACLARLSSHVDIILPFQNSYLERAKADVRVDGIESHFDDYIEANKSLVAFLEAFSMSSIPSANNAGIKGSGKFDVYDPINPIQDVNPRGYEEDEKPATLFAPAHAKTARSEFSVRDLRRLLKMLVQQPLAEFDPTTAWGASLLFYGPEAVKGTVRDVCKKHLLKEAVDVFDVDPEFDFTLNQYYITVPSLDEIHLWGGFWNPEMEIIEDCSTHAQKHIEQGTEWGERLRGDETESQNLQNNLQNLQNNLGREAFK